MRFLIVKHQLLGFESVVSKKRVEQNRVRWVVEPVGSRVDFNQSEAIDRQR